MMLDLEITDLPCGNGCGTSFTIPGRQDPAEIQRAALDAGWGITTVDGSRVVVCRKCKGRIDEK